MTKATKGSDDVPRGIIWMIAATVLFAISNAIVKWTVAVYPPGEVLFLRSLTTFAVVGLVLFPRFGLSIYTTKIPLAHCARGVSQSVSQGLTVLALALLPLATATAISFTTPLWAALIAIIFLREKLSVARGAVLLAGFAGVLIIIRPGSEVAGWGALFALGNALMYGSVTVAVRGMTKTENTNCLLIWQVSLLAFLHAALLPLGFQWPSYSDFLLLIACGVSNAAAQYAWTRALVCAPTAAVAPFYYLLLVWSIMIGFIVWQDLPTAQLTIGSGIIIVAGLLLILHERRAAKAG